MNNDFINTNTTTSNYQEKVEKFMASMPDEYEYEKDKKALKKLKKKKKQYYTLSKKEKKKMKNLKKKVSYEKKILRRNRQQAVRYCQELVEQQHKMEKVNLLYNMMILLKSRNVDQIFEELSECNIKSILKQNGGTSVGSLVPLLIEDKGDEENDEY